MSSSTLVPRCLKTTQSSASSVARPAPSAFRRDALHHDPRLAVTVTLTLNIPTDTYGVAAGSVPEMSRDVVSSPTTYSPVEDCPMSESTPTPTTQVHEESAAATLRSGIIGGCVAILGISILATILYVFYRHRRQIAAINSGNDVEHGARTRRPRFWFIPRRRPATRTDVTPYNIIDLCEQNEVDIEKAAFSEVLHISSDVIRPEGRPELPPTYSSLGIISVPGNARRKATSTVAQNMRSSQLEVPEISETRCVLPKRGTWSP